MSATKPVLAACLAVALGYLAYPYVTLYQLDEAIHRGDAQTLQQLVNWPAVREGIKEDICDNQTAEPTNELPSFGSSFVRGAAAQAIDQHVTPEALVAVVHQPAGEPVVTPPKMHLNWAFFDSPTQFTADLSAGHGSAPIRVQLELKDARWQVTRVWLPPKLLDQANARV